MLKKLNTNYFGNWKQEIEIEQKITHSKTYKMLIILVKKFSQNINW